MNLAMLPSTEEFLIYRGRMSYAVTCAVTVPKVTVSVSVPSQMAVEKDGNAYTATLEIRDVTMEDAGKYKVTAKNELGESSAAISLNFDGEKQSV